jgi:hypothetical protein
MGCLKPFTRRGMYTMLHTVVPVLQVLRHSGTQYSTLVILRTSNHWRQVEFVFRISDDQMVLSSIGRNSYFGIESYICQQNYQEFLKNSISHTKQTIHQC